MKKTFTIAALVAAIAAFASEPLLPKSDSRAPLGKEMNEKSKSFFYLRMSGADSQPVDSINVLPGVGVGYRLNAGSSAIDFSANMSRGRDDGKKVYFYTLPKASYLYYLSPASSQSLYAGAGLAWGSMRNHDAKKFEGIVPSATVGLEMNRNSVLRSFLQLDVSQPAIAARKSDGKFPGPMAELSLGLGF